MKEFDYALDYKVLDFTDSETRNLYRIGRGEQGVLNEKAKAAAVFKVIRDKAAYDPEYVIMRKEWRNKE